MARKALDELLQKKNEAIQVEYVEIIKNPLRALKDGITFIPTLKCGNEKLSGLLLSKDKISEFLGRVESS